MARNSRELEQRPAVDPEEEPSVDWGWHGHFYRAKIIAGVLTILILIAFLPGPYQSGTQVLWVVGISLLIAFMIWRSVVAHRNSWRR